MRNLRSLPVDVVVIDLGAGAHFNTLDFFGMSDRGIVITAPDPGALTNAYGFIKGALFRKIQGVFKNHPAIARAVDAEIKTGGDELKFSLEWFSAMLKEVAPGLVPVIGEIEQSFSPALVINGAPAGTTHPLVRNLITLCKDRLGITLEHVGDIPETREISNHLLNVPQFFNMRDGEPYVYAVGKIMQRLVGTGIKALLGRQAAPFVMENEDRDEIVCFIDTLDDSVFMEAGKDTWKLRMFFRPSDVVSYLISRGVTHRAFSNYE
jgi:flagellar biosynthesis protein FlhG